MDINSTEFIASHPNTASCPKEEKHEFAFIGRSNVGKSSLINMLTGKKGLAKVSQTPGKTQLINFFLINKFWYLVDLPGYGYAKVSKTKQKGLARLLNDYFSNRTQLTLAFVLIDSNINPPSKVDLAFLDEMGNLAVPYVLIFTKSDKIGKVTLDRNIDAFMSEMSKNWDTLPQYFISSSERRTGRQEILDFIGQIIGQ
ncbi:MAG: YihA family ribosome biogenesis GTP-binding protein [Saprospiraceae bacterium]|nr:YihA family ribosome biogenesis GTP-binding protein [Saprospiraceae bacterium]